jgi:hypothetical protein
MGWETMGTAAEAVAGLPVRANNHIALCTDSCSGISSNPASPTVLSPPRVLERDPNAAGNLQFAWTSLLTNMTSTTEVSALICSELPNAEVCGQMIYTTQGTSSSAFKDLEAVFNDPSFDRDNKEFSGSQVTAWWILSPVVDPCPVTSQGVGNGTEPKFVTKYAMVRIISACDQGGGNPCRPYSSPTCTNPRTIVIDRIACIDCANISDVSGLKTVLVR